MALPYPDISAAAAARTAVNIGAAADDGTGDPLRIAFTRSNARDAGLELAIDQAKANFDSLDARSTSLEASAQFLNWRGDWVTATAYVYTAGVRRDMFRDAGTGDVYVVLQSHTSTSLAADEAAGKIAHTDEVQNTADLAALKPAVAALQGDVTALEGATAVRLMMLAGYTALRAHAGTEAVVTLTDEGVSGVFAHDASDTTSADNGGTIIVGADARRWKRRWHGEVQARWFGLTAAGLQAALNVAGTTGGAVVLPDAVYTVPSETIDVPANVIMRGIGPQSEIRRTSNINAPLVRAQAAANVSVRDLKLGSTAGFSSASSITIGTGTKTFTVPAGLDLTAGDDYMVSVGVSASAHNYMIGEVASYSGTTLEMTIASVVGSGAFTSWRFARYDGANCALQFDNCAGASAQGLVVQGRFYVGIVAQNSEAHIEGNDISEVVNRPIYVYAISAGVADGSRVSKNRVRGGGFTQYGINLNGSGGTIENVVIAENVVDNTLFQGIEVGGSCSLVTVSDNQVDDVISPGGVGILVQRANTVQPSRVTVKGNCISGAGSAGIHVIDAFYTNVVGNQVTVTITGIRYEQITTGVGCQYGSVVGNQVNSCSFAGVLFIGAVAGLCSFHACSANVAVLCGTGVQSTANTDRIAFAGNVGGANTTNYSTLGSNHQVTGNV